MEQKKIFIVKWLPEGDTPHVMRGQNNHAYETFKKAEDRCKWVAAETRRPVGIFELVAAYQPPMDVEAITITGKGKAKNRT